MGYKKRLLTMLSALNARERVLVGITALCLACTLCYLIIEAVQNHVADTERLVHQRTTHLEQLSQVITRFRTLDARLKKLQTTFAEAQMTFEEVTSQLDAIVKESIGSDNYDLKKGRSPTQVGFEYEKQEFTVKIKSLTLEQIVKLLHRLEEGKSPLFLGKVDLLKSTSGEDFSATLEIFSIRKS